MDAAKRMELEEHAKHVRINILKSIHQAQSGHTGGSLGAADIFTYLYFQEMKIDPKQPEKKDRDRFVLSKGHCAPGLYAVLAEKGYIPEKELETLRQIGSPLQGHPNMDLVPGIDMTTGSLGQGISAAVGMALALRLQKEPSRVFCLTGDGELQEGEVWEALMSAAHYHLDHLVIIVDRNHLQIDGSTEEVMDIEPLQEKLVSFGLEVISAQGNDFESLEAAFQQMSDAKKPKCIIAHTHKGQGVSFMQDQAGWHGKAPNDEELQLALKEILGE